MDLFGKQAKKENEDILSRAQSELKGMGIPDDQISAFMAKVTKKEAAAGSAPEEPKGGANPPSEESGAQGKPSDKSDTGGAEANGQSPSQGEPAAKPEASAEGNAPQPDYKALYEEQTKANEALSNRLKGVEDAIIKMGSLQQKGGFGNEQKVPNGAPAPSDDAASAAEEASTPRHSIPQPQQK